MLSRQQDRVRLFEIGRSFHGTLQKPLETQQVAGLILGTSRAEQWSDSAQAVDFFDIKSDVESLLRCQVASTILHFAVTEHPALQPGQAARIHRARDSGWRHRQAASRVFRSSSE